MAATDGTPIRAHLGDIRGRRILIVGDIAHSRVARSNIWALSTMGADVVVCGPPTLLPAGLRVGAVFKPARPEGLDTDDRLALPPVQVETDLERMQGGLLPSIREYATLYQLNEERMSRARTGALIMHPGPMNEGIEISPALASSLQSVIEEQVTNGVAVRMAVLYLLARGKQG